jgi:hypothetical protein
MFEVCVGVAAVVMMILGRADRLKKRWSDQEHPE